MAKAQILVVEDEGIVAMDVRNRLNGLGYAVSVVVSSGEEAFKKAGEVHPDLVLMDIRLKGDMDGIEAAEQIRARFDVPVVYLTAYADDNTLQRAKVTEPFGYLLKPFEERELHTAIEIALYKHKIEKKLKESEERYRSLFENANDGIVTFTLDGTITAVNRELEVMTGWSRGELIGQHYRKVAPTAYAALGDERTRRALAGETLPSIFEVEVVCKDGRVVPVEARTRFIHDKEGKPVGFQGIYRDISAKKELERLRADFLAMLTHDIKNPLGAILGYTMLLREMWELNSEEEEMARRIEISSRAVLSLVNNYLNLSKIEAGHLTLVKTHLGLNDLLSRVGQQYEAEARRQQITLEFRLQQEPLLVEGDSLALERVFVNLLHNALKFTPKLGRVTISSGRHNGEVVVAVADTGPGIAPEEVPFIFDKYRQTTAGRSRKGVGLWLFIVKTLVEAHGGRVEVESTPGQGSCFSVFLPVASAEPAEA